MVKRLFSVGMIALLLSGILVGCGISQKQYDDLVDQLEAVQQELQSVKNDLSTAQDTNVELTSELEQTMDQVSILQTNLADAETQVSTLEARMSPKLSLSSPRFDGLTLTVDGVIIQGICDSTIARVHWDWGDGNSEDHLLPASHTYSAFGKYTITVTAYQSDEFTSTKAINIDIPVVFPDSNLEAVIREAINKLEGAIHTSDLQSLTTLEAEERGILDLSRLEYCINLQELWLVDYFSDLSPIANLTNLRELRISSHIRDYTPLENLINLETLELGWIMDYSNLTPVTRITSLKMLNLHSGAEFNIPPLAGLVNLETLVINHPNLNDVSPLAGLTNLKELYLYHNISDLSPLSSLTSLFEFHFENNNISDLSPLIGLTNLFELRLEGNNISDISPLLENPGIGQGGLVDIRDNPFNQSSIDAHIPALQERGVRVEW